MKILISADMEGATGVTWPADVLPGSEQWQRCRRMFTSDVNAAIAGFHDGGADEVLVNEAHWTMRNLLLEELDERAQMLTGRHKDLSMVEGASALAASSEHSPGELARRVASPGGTTQAGLDVLDRGGAFARLIEDTLRGARDRSAEMAAEARANS